MSIDAILGPGGAIAKLLGNYEARRQQLDMARAVEDAIAEKRHLIVEAGTGVGKSFAYLVPALQAALADPECRVVISTHTISLQEQLVRKDIPFLQKVLPKPVSALLVKGRSNYLSKRRLRVATRNAASLLVDDRPQQELFEIATWARKSTDGSRSDLRFRPSPRVWDMVESDSTNCMGKKCENFDDCFYFRARRSINQAQLLVVNHALFFADLMVRSLAGGEYGILPRYQVVVFDEAHTLEDVAAEHLGLNITRGQIDFLLNKLIYERRGQLLGLLSAWGDDVAFAQVQRCRDAAAHFFDELARWRHEEQGRTRRHPGPPAETQRVRRAEVVANALSGEMEAMAREIDRLLDRVVDEEIKMELESASTRCYELGQGLDAWLKQAKEGQVYWIDGTGQPGQRLAMTSAPIEVGPILRELLWQRVPTAILTSATLTTSGRDGFQFFQQRIGLEDAPTLTLGSPFNYPEQAELHLFRAMPDPVGDSAGFEAACLEKIKDYVVRTRGRAFVLFTSTQTMERSANQLRQWFRSQGLLLLCQSDGLPATQLVEQFRTSPAAVLFGVDTFWQGVDVPGEALSNVIITKLPFVPPDRPLVEARGEALRARGGDPFLELSLPQAILKLKQGFGRLIRTTTDRGMVVILDPRMLTRRYGRAFLDALPACRRFVDGL